MELPEKSLVVPSSEAPETPFCKIGSEKQEMRDFKYFRRKGMLSFRLEGVYQKWCLAWNNEVSERLMDQSVGIVFSVW